MKPGKHTPFPSSAKLKAGRAAAADEGIWLGLVSLMLYAQPRRDARRDTQGEYAPLAEPDAARWDATLIEEAEALRLRASTPPGTGRYPLPATRYPLPATRWQWRWSRRPWFADAAYERAIGLETDPAVRRSLLRCRAELRVSGS